MTVDPAADNKYCTLFDYYICEMSIVPLTLFLCIVGEYAI